MPSLTLIHSTYYQGNKLRTSFARIDQESGAKALWFQTVPGMSLRAKQCCNYYGDRKIKLTPNWFAGWLSSKGRLTWNIYKVSLRIGNNPVHHFSKYLIVRSDDTFDTAAENNFEQVGRMIKSHEVWNKFAAIAFSEMNLNDMRIFNHVHVGLVGTPDLRITR